MSHASCKAPHQLLQHICSRMPLRHTNAGKERSDLSAPWPLWVCPARSLHGGLGSPPGVSPLSPRQARPSPASKTRSGWGGGFGLPGWWVPGLPSGSREGGVTEGRTWTLTLGVLRGCCLRSRSPCAETFRSASSPRWKEAFHLVFTGTRRSGVARFSYCAPDESKRLGLL